MVPLHDLLETVYCCKFNLDMVIFPSNFQRYCLSANVTSLLTNVIFRISILELHHQIHSLLDQLVSMIEERNFPEAMAIIHRLKRFEDVYKARNHRT